MRERPSFVAEGSEVRKPRDDEGSVDGDVPECVCAVVESMERSCWIVAALFARVFRRARFSLRVSWTLRRRARIDSGVGLLAGRGSVRPYCVLCCDQYMCDNRVGQSKSDKSSRHELQREIYLIMPQPHPRCQFIRYRQDIP